jgi:tryptophan synthase alpha chain
MKPHERLSEALGGDGVSVVPYLTGGYPDRGSFAGHLDALGAVSPALEVGIPFSDPMADGATIQASSAKALARGATLEGVIETLEQRADADLPLIVMSYLNPLLAFGPDRVMSRLAGAGVCALVIPDLPLEEGGLVADAAAKAGIGLVQMVTPVTDSERRRSLCRASQGFVYAVTMTGTTGGDLDESGVGSYLDELSEVAEVPVVAGFGVRTRHQVEALSEHCDGVIVGSAIVETIGSGGDPVALVEDLNKANAASST